MVNHSHRCLLDEVSFGMGMRDERKACSVSMEPSPMSGRGQPEASGIDRILKARSTSSTVGYVSRKRGIEQSCMCRSKRFNFFRRTGTFSAEMRFFGAPLLRKFSNPLHFESSSLPSRTTTKRTSLFLLEKIRITL
ncbi:MAG TPA: hypothetical protein PKY50_10920 [Candidatus Competibacter sp.]|nr:hypothetical protein [Candidatus Competibacter sp.]